jgi:hypothetical protein
MFKISDNNDILISKGESVIFTIPISMENGSTYTLKSNQHLEMAIKKTKNDADATKRWVGVDGSDEIYIPYNDTAELTAGDYWYDVVAITKVDESETEKKYVTFPRRFTVVSTIS